MKISLHNMKLMPNRLENNWALVDHTFRRFFSKLLENDIKNNWRKRYNAQRF
jgi:hypothetical protein